MCPNRSPVSPLKVVKRGARCNMLICAQTCAHDIERGKIAKKSKIGRFRLGKKPISTENITLVWVEHVRITLKTMVVEVVAKLRLYKGFLTKISRLVRKLLSNW